MNKCKGFLEETDKGFRNEKNTWKMTSQKNFIFAVTICNFYRIDSLHEKIKLS